MVPTSRDGRDTARRQDACATDGHGCAAVGCRAVAQLAVLVSTPAGHRAVGFERAGVRIARRNGRGPAQATHDHGCAAVACRAIAQLALNVITPAHHRAVGFERAGVRIARRNLCVTFHIQRETACEGHKTIAGNKRKGVGTRRRGCAHQLVGIQRQARRDTASEGVGEGVAVAVGGAVGLAEGRTHVDIGHIGRGVIHKNRRSVGAYRQIHTQHVAAPVAVIGGDGEGVSTSGGGRAGEHAAIKRQTRRQAALHRQRHGVALGVKHLRREVHGEVGGVKGGGQGNKHRGVVVCTAARGRARQGEVVCRGGLSG